MTLLSRASAALNDARWRHGVFWPLLVSTRGRWEDYVERLSVNGRRYYRRAAKLNGEKAVRVVPFDRAQVASFMELWGRHFAFAPGYLSRLEALARRGRMTCFEARAGGTPVALQLVETYGPYGRCHAPWFDKPAHEAANLATFMWFAVIERAMRGGSFHWLDLGGGPASRLAPDHYKRRYAPEEGPRLLRRCPACAYMFVVEPESASGDLACPECGAACAVDWRARAVLAVSRLPSPAAWRARARTTRSA